MISWRLKTRVKRSVPLGLILPEVRLSKAFSGRNLREGERLPTRINLLAEILGDNPTVYCD
jgi:hypothetical protein